MAISLSMCAFSEINANPSYFSDVNLAHCVVHTTVGSQKNKKGNEGFRLALSNKNTMPFTCVTFNFLEVTF